MITAVVVPFLLFYFFISCYFVSLVLAFFTILSTVTDGLLPSWVGLMISPVLAVFWPLIILIIVLLFFLIKNFYQVN